MWQQESRQRDPTAWENHRRYWSAQLKGIPDELPLPTDRPRPAVASHHGDLVDFDLSVELCRDLEELAHENSTSLFVVLQAGLACLLTRFGAGEDITVGSPIAGRHDSALDELVGFFVNWVVLRTDTSGNPSFGELLHRVRECWLSADTHQDVPFELLVEDLNPPRSLARNPLFQSIARAAQHPRHGADLEGLSGPWRIGSARAAKFDLAFNLIPQPGDDSGRGGLEGTVEFATDLFDAATVERMVARFLLLLRDAADHPDRPIGSLRIMDEHERRKLLAENGVPADGQTVVQRFRAQVDQRSGQIAVTDSETPCPTESWTTARKPSPTSSPLGAAIRSPVWPC